MSKKPAADTFQQKISRNDRFAQMSHQEKVIEQKKKEILAKLEAKEKTKSEATKTKADNSKQGSKSGSNSQKEVKNIFTNDGSFLDQFKQIKDKSKFDSKLKSFSLSKDHDKNHNDDRNKSNRWTSRRRSPSPKDRLQKRNFSRFSSEKVLHFEPKITINTSFSSTVSQQPQNFEVQTSIQSISITPQDVTGQPLLKNILPPPTITYSEVIQQQPSETVITAPPVLIDIPPPHIVQAPQMNRTLVLAEAPQPQQNILVSAPLQSILTTVSLPPPLVTNVGVNAQNALPVPQPCLPTVELASIPPPNPIQVQNIPQPEPINALNIPQPAPIQVQNIPTPNSIQLNEIPNPKPLDLLTIPTPNEDQGMSDPDFIKNIPPPNKSVPPPQIQETTVSLIAAPQAVSTTIAQNVLIHNVHHPNQIQTIQNITAPTNQILQSQPAFSSVTVTLPVGVVQVSSTPPAIPSLMAQPILPPPGMGLNVNVNCPPPLLPSTNNLQQHMTTFVNQPTTANQMPSMNIPPPGGLQILGALPNMGCIQGIPGFKNLNAVFPPGSAEYESMASLGRMVAECGDSIEDIVRQRKNQDPNLWFLFHKESAAYQQYRQLIQQIQQENEIKKKIEEAQIGIKQEDIYEPETALEDMEDVKIKNEFKDEYIFQEDASESERKRKRKSRWGDKELNIAPPSVILYNPSGINSINSPISMVAQSSQNNVLLSKVTRNESGLIQYAINTYGSANLSEEDWKKAEDSYKIHLLYQDMVKRREEVDMLKRMGKNKYEYDSDEDTDGGTWEHKAREKEMVATQLWAQELTRQAEGKHHIGDFLPPEELKRFMENSSAAKEGRQPSFSDYKEFKIKEDNIGFKMLQKLGWTEGQGLGTSGTGIVEPINKAAPREHTQGLGLNQMEDNEDEYESYRKRMMLAYRFRPNPLNNPRRPYY